MKPDNGHNSTISHSLVGCTLEHDDVIKWKHFLRYWPFVRGIHRSPVNSPHKGQWRGVLMFSLICAWINGSINNREAGDLRRHRAHYDVIIMNMNSQQTEGNWRTSGSRTEKRQHVFHQHGLTEISAWVINYVHNFLVTCNYLSTP